MDCDDADREDLKQNRKPSVNETEIDFCVWIL